MPRFSCYASLNSPSEQFHANSEVFEFLEREGPPDVRKLVSSPVNAEASGIGTCHALFYEAAAANLERQHKFQQAEDVQPDFDY